MKPKTDLPKQLAELTEQFRRLKSECDGVSDSYVSLRSEYDEQAKQLAAANELLSSIRQENRRLALAVASQTMRIAELERQPEAAGEIEQLRKEREFLRTQSGLVETDDILKAISQYKHVQQEIATLKAQIEQLRPENQRPRLLQMSHIDCKRFEQAPCYICGYNGAGYYQPDAHPCAKAFHEQEAQ